MKHFVLTRQRWLVDPANANMAQANTLLITGIPQKYLTEAALMDLFNVLPGGVRKIWLNRFVHFDLIILSDRTDVHVSDVRFLGT